MVIERNMDDSWYEFWIAYECVLLAFVLCTLLKLSDYWILMKTANMDTEDADDISTWSDLSRVYNDVMSLVSVTLTMTVFWVCRLVMSVMQWFHIDWTLRKSSGTVVMVVACALIVASGAWQGDYFPSTVVWQYKFANGFRLLPVATVAPVAVYFLLFATIVATITKRYVLWKVYFWQPSIAKNIVGDFPPKSTVLR